jgi:hypothetical protein
MNHAIYEGQARVLNRTDNREMKRRGIMGKRDTSMPLGDGNAEVSSTRGFKKWVSTRAAGLTIESTVGVRLHCGQSEEEVREAAMEASRLAEVLSMEGLEEMETYTDKFLAKCGVPQEERAIVMSSDPPPPPSRRSEHPKHRRAR